MPISDKNTKLTSKYLSKEVEDVLHKIKSRSEETCKCRLRVVGIPYLGTCSVEKEHDASLPYEERKKARVMSIRPGICQGAGMRVIRCDVFCRDVIDIVDEELSGLIGRVGGISFFISVH